MKKNFLCNMVKRIISPPPPFVVFSSKLEVGKCNSDECRDYKENNENYEEYAVDGVSPMSPHTGKYVVKFNVDGTER